MANGRATPFTQGPGPSGGPGGVPGQGVSPQQAALLGRGRENLTGEPADVEMVIMDPNIPIGRILAIVTQRIVSEPTPQTAAAVQQFAATLTGAVGQPGQEQAMMGAAPQQLPPGPGVPAPGGFGGPPAPGAPLA